MPSNDSILETLPPVHFATLGNAAVLNAKLIEAFEREKSCGSVRQTHHFFGRFENTYVDRKRLPEIAPVVEFAHAKACQRLAKPALHLGYWFNEMHPGHRTSLHAHEELDELLSAVYYCSAPENSGRLLLRDGPVTIAITPAAGMLVMFPPDLPHEVETNRSDATRLSIAFNFGPIDVES
jgi:hypothetical protein